MAHAPLTIAWRFWFYWALAFLGFPLGGLLAHALVGPVTTMMRASLAGIIAGAIIGFMQWLVLKGQIPLPMSWVAATSGGMALGLAISVTVLGSETSGDPLLWRAAITGLSIGVMQGFVLRSLTAPPSLWIGLLWLAVLTLSWVIGWFITRIAGVDLSYKWPVFGASGALTFQLLTGLALSFVLRSLQATK